MVEMIFFPKCFQLEIREGDGKLHQTGRTHLCLVVLIERLEIPLLVVIKVVSNVISIRTKCLLGAVILATNIHNNVTLLQNVLLASTHDHYQ